MNDISIIGAGRLGTSLGHALSKKGYRIKALSCRTYSSAEESRQIIGEGTASTDNIHTANVGELVFMCLPDNKIVPVTGKLASSNINFSKKYVFHCSGLFPSEILEPLKAKGALTASFHPIQSFSNKKTNPKQFEGIYIGLEGCSEALSLAQKTVQKLQGHPLILQAKDKALYHVACSTASNFFVVLLDMAVSLLKNINIQEEKAFEMLLPLVKGTLHNVKKFNTSASLTGPVVRGDQKSIQKHLDALENLPSYYETYKKLSIQALEIAEKEKKLTQKKIKELRNLLAGK
ncbi:MAG: DUF2520 domain-containing protein [Candidatus Aminicenantes bacterium]|nr:DUF2520 domain-containing protein [Candidatus Aminicenantes bacterium]